MVAGDSIGASLIAILFAFGLARWVLSHDTGTPEMKKVSDAIYTGAQAFLRRQYTTIAILAVVAAIVIGVLLAALSKGGLFGENAFNVGLRTSIAFAIGAICSGVAGYIGMQVAVQSNIRVASAARRSLGESLMVSLRGGAVSGFLVIALSLLGVTIVYLIFGGPNNPLGTPETIVGFGFGASFVALFAQLGGGIYTKAADVGADLVGKVEAGIPEDDPRNPAVIADLVGDNVGDCAGRGADIFESTAAENIGAMILGAAVAAAIAGQAAAKRTRRGSSSRWSSSVWAFLLAGRPPHGAQERRKEPAQAGGRDPGEIAMGELNIGYYITAVLAVIAIIAAVFPAPALDRSLVGLRHRWRHRRADEHRLRAHHPVLHLWHVPPGARDRRGQQDRPSDNDHLRHRGRLSRTLPCRCS